MLPDETLAAHAPEAPGRGASITRRHRRMVEGTVVASLLTIAVAVWFLPVTLHLGSRILSPDQITPAGVRAGGPSDGSSALTDYWAIRTAHGTPFTLQRNPYIAAPEGLPISPAVNLASPLQPGIVWLLAYGVGFVAAWNLFLALGFVATGTAFFLLFRSLRFGMWSSFIGAYVVALSPWAAAKAKWGQPALVHLWPLAVAAALLLRATRRQTLASRVVAGVAVGGATYCAFYVGVLTLVLAVVAVAVALVAPSPEIPLRMRARRAFEVLGSALLVLLPVVVLSRVADTSIIVRTGGEDFYGVGFRRFLLPPAENPIVGRWFPGLIGASDIDLYFGTTTLLAAMAGAVAAFLRRPRTISTETRRVVLTATAVGVVGALLALPPTYAIFGTVVSTPSRAAADLLPQFRTVARYGVLTVAGAALIAAFAFSFLERRRWGRPVLAVVLAATVAQLATTPPVRMWNEAKAPAYVSWLARHPGGILAVYPMLRYGIDYEEHSEYAWQPLHGHPLFNLYGGDPRRFDGTREDAIRAAVKFVNDTDTPPLLASEHVKYVVVRLDSYRHLGEAPPIPAPGLLRVFHSSRADILRVTSPPLPTTIDTYMADHTHSIALTLGSGNISASPTSGFYGPELQSDGSTRRWMRREGTIHVENDSWDGPIAVSFSAWPAGNRGRTLYASMNGKPVATVAVPPAGTDVRFQVDVPPGGADIELTTVPGPEQLSVSDHRRGSVYLTDPAADPILVWKKL